MPFEWTGNTVPFVDLANHTPARLVLEQVDDDQFRLEVWRGRDRSGQLSSD
jgi:hypothetical protein